MNKNLKISIVFMAVGVIVFFSALWAGCFIVYALPVGHWALFPVFVTSALLAVIGIFTAVLGFAGFTDAKV